MRRKLTFEEAKALLNKGEYVHTYRQGGYTLLGADWLKKDLLESMKKNESTLEIGGSMCRDMKHGLVLEDNVGYLFIETDTDKLNSFDPL